MYRVQRVDNEKTQWRNVLCAMQLICLPGDDVFAPVEGWWWVVFDDQKTPVGFCGMVPSGRWGDCLYFCRSGLLPEHRGKGLQKKMLKARLKLATSLGYNWVVTDTYNNPASSNSLISCGFKLFEPSKPWAGDGTLYWRRPCHTKTQKYASRKTESTPGGTTRKTPTR